MATPTLHYHPLSSYCHKVLVAIDVLDAEVDKQLLNLGDPAERDAYFALWPVGKMPLLVDGGRPIPEASIIIEHLQRHHARSGATLIPRLPDEALDVRLWDRVFDLYVMTPMQALTADLLKPEGERDRSRSPARAWPRPTPSSTASSPVTPGPSATPSAWPIAPRRRRCSMPGPMCRSTCRRIRGCRPTWIA